MKKNSLTILNKKASYNYELLEFYIAGICLKGTEIKSIKDSKVNLSSGFCVFRNNEIYIRGLQISEYTFGNINNHDPMREKKLLLNKNEIMKLKKISEEKKLVIIPKKLFINERGIAKLEIALARGKKLFDKRESIKEKEIKRRLKKNIKTTL